MFFMLGIFLGNISFIMIMFSTFLLQGDDRGKAPAVEQTTTSSRQQVYVIVIFEIKHEKYIILLCCFPQYIAFILVMFYIFLLQAIDSSFDLALDKSIDIDVDEIMHDVDIGSSLDPIKIIENNLTKLLRISFVCYLFNRIQTRVKKRLMFW